MVIITILFRIAFEAVAPTYILSQIKAEKVIDGTIAIQNGSLLKVG